MPSTKLFFENRLDRPVWLLLRAAPGRLEIHLYDAPYSNAAEIEPRRMRTFDVDDRIRSCMDENPDRPGKASLKFSFLSHCTMKPQAAFVPCRHRFPEGPIFEFVPVLN